MPDAPRPTGEIVLYQTEDGRTRLECRFADNNVWLTQALMAELFQTTPQNITLHLKSIYEEGELVEAATCKDYLQVQTEIIGLMNEANHSVGNHGRISVSQPGPVKLREIRGIRLIRWVLFLRQHLPHSLLRTTGLECWKRERRELLPAFRD